MWSEEPGARAKTCSASVTPHTLPRMRVRGAIIGLAATGLLVAATGAAGAAVFRKGPYLQNVSHSSVTILWESSRSCDGVLRLLDVTPPRSIAVDPDSADDDVYEVVVTDLAPGRRYRYEVECRDAKSTETVAGEFATAPEAGAPFAFVVFGDSRSNADAHRMMVERIRREVPDFLLGTGDMVDDGSKDRQWEAFFDIERELLAENVLFPSVGNHDRQGRGRTADNYRKFFSLPENSPDPERYYAFTYGSGRFLVLDSNAYSFSLTDQTAWIEQQLQAARLDPAIEHIFVTMHHPPYSISLHGGQKELRERWTPLFEKYDVTAVFSGHDHVYSRAESNDVHYFVTGGAGAPIYPRARQPSALDLQATRYFERVHHYLRVQVIGKFVEISAIRADGTLIETLSWGPPPRPDQGLPVASSSSSSSGAGSGSGSGEAGVQSPAAGAGQAASAVRAAAMAAPEGESRFGFLGKLGAAMIFLAAGVLVWTLRS